LTKLGRYEVLNELGKGAMGVVYLAKDPVIGRMVAIKTIRTSQSGDDDSESREFRERFVREAQTAGILSHPNIVTIHDIGEDTESRTSFIAMEYIECASRSRRRRTLGATSLARSTTRTVAASSTATSSPRTSS
jgi:serine/threonine-protein kinase